MINDKEGMDNALEYYTNGGWKWLLEKEKEEEEVTNTN